MKRLAVVVCLLAACTTVAPPPLPTPQQLPAPPSPNALIAVTNVARTIQDPRIRVGMLSDQTSVSFPRVAGGYYVITDAGASTLRRGLTLTAPLSDVSPHYAVQVSAISDEASANELAQKLRIENAGMRVDV